MDKNIIRLDKFLTEAGIGTRSEVKHMIRKHMVSVDGIPVDRPEIKIRPFAGSDGDTTVQTVAVHGKRVEFDRYSCYMLYKPAGVVTATEDKTEKTVLDLFQEERERLKKGGYFPVGRLDKDTEGLLLVTNDGELAHRLLSPRKHVAKTYFVRAEGYITEKMRNLLEGGLDLGGGERSSGAKVSDLRYGSEDGLNTLCARRIRSETVQNESVRGERAEFTELKITIYEGKYHQIKRMFTAVGSKVRYLKRLSMGNLVLDGALAPGEYRRLSQSEQAALYAECFPKQADAAESDFSGGKMKL